MTKYLVQVKFEFNDEIVVEADDVYEANSKAEEVLSNEYSVYQISTESYLDFEDIYGYDPEEVK